MKYKNYYIIAGIILVGIIYLAITNGQVTYVNDFNLQNVEDYYIHDSNAYPLFLMEDGSILMLDADEKDQTRAQVLFATHEESRNEVDVLNFKDITDDIPLLNQEDIIQVHPYFEGWLFLTNLGNVYRYVLDDSPNMTKEYYVNGQDNLISLEEDEQIISIYYDSGFQMEVLSFETNLGNVFRFYEDNLNSIFGYELYDDSIFLDGEEAFKTLLFWQDDAYFIVTNNQRVLRYDTVTKQVMDVSLYFVLELGEDIIAFHYESNYATVFVTNKGRVVKMDLDNLVEVEDSYLDIDLGESEEIIKYQTGYYACREGMALITTSDNTYYYATGIDEEFKELDTSFSDDAEDSIKDIKLSNYGSHSCSSNDQILYQGVELRDFNFIISISTNNNHEYLLGVREYSSFTEEPVDYLILQMK
jgi:hypothetical protein